ncbi:eukaryotic membrane protein family-domain-containing protein [Fusarium acuminatum]|uniref:Eukaryotic membrane protein family-domain-containing protein n=1 Tax=Fusarium acuminatum TaxID=5515 RepID=A0ABZ2X2X1_9HYPO
MAASVDSINAHRLPPLLSPRSSPPPSTCADEAPEKLPTIPSDEDHSSEEGSHVSGSLRRVASASSSISEPAVEDDEEEELEVEPVEDTVEKERDQDESKDLDTAVPSGRASRSSTISNTTNPNVRRLSASEMQRLTNSPESLPVAPAPQRRSIDQDSASHLLDQREAIRQSTMRLEQAQQTLEAFPSLQPNSVAVEARASGSAGLGPPRDIQMDFQRRPSPGARTLSTPPTTRPLAGDLSGTSSPRRYSSFNPAGRPTSLHLNLDGSGGTSPVLNTRSGPATAIPVTESSGLRPPSPIPPIIPLPPMSLPTHLQLELAAQRPSPLYIHQSHAYDIPYESNAAKFERLKNVLFLPPFLERTLNFGALACLDAWLYNFTILPMRFTLALGVLVHWWFYLVLKEVRWLVDYVWYGLGRLWRRGRTSRSTTTDESSDETRSRSESRPRGRTEDANETPELKDLKTHLNAHFKPLQPRSQPRSGAFRHRRTKSMPSNLSAFHKADLLRGAVIICSSMTLMTLDASRMYHFIRAQSAIKLYVIYNILEVGDRLLSALGQDILECLFSTETLSRNASGRSKVLLPLGMFLLALAYCCLHSIALYYQVITLNVAVNSYSNALLTLLLSNQFVEIKSTVFKRFEKDNLFQLTCADIVERFQLWIMLLIIGMRNIIEVGGLSIPGAGSESQFDGSSVPLHNPSILPHSFTVLPSWLMSGEVLSPFLIVIGSEMLVDAIKHAYVTKFNNIKPSFYSRILDILCKDYYTNAFMAPSLTKRLGLAVIPLSCLFIRASIQTYHMLLSTHLPMPLPIPESTQTSLTEESATPSSPAMIAALNRFDSLIRDSLGRATYGYPYGSPLNSRPWYSWTSDDVIAAITMVVVFFIAFLVLLILKLLLGMLLLKYARNRYARMKRAEHQGRAPESFDTPGARRVGGFGQVEVGEERQRWIHADRNEGLKGGKGPGKRNEKPTEKTKKDDFEKVMRYEMVAKRIW